MLLGWTFILLLAVAFGLALWRWGAPGEDVQAKPRHPCCSPPDVEHASSGVDRPDAQCH